MSAPPPPYQDTSKEQEAQQSSAGQQPVAVAPGQVPVMVAGQVPPGGQVAMMAPGQVPMMAPGQVPMMAPGQVPMMAPGGQVYVQPATVPMMGFQPPLAPEFQPNDYLIISLLVIIVCGIFNLTSMFFSVPAIICSALAHEKKSNRQYMNAKRLGLAAIVLDIMAVMWTCAWGIIFTGVYFGCIFIECDGY